VSAQLHKKINKEKGFFLFTGGYALKNFVFDGRTFKETVSRDFLPLVFFHKSTAPRPLTNTLKYFRILFRILGAIRL
jgi:hypothetical protein